MKTTIANTNTSNQIEDDFVLSPAIRRIIARNEAAALAASLESNINIDSLLVKRSR